MSGQRVWLVDEGETVVGGWPVSGRAGFPKPGTYRVFSKSRVSSSGPLKLEYMTRFLKASSGLAVGFHAIPTRRGAPIQTEGQLGSFTSRGCVRQRPQDAAVLWEFAPIGTMVTVTR